MSEVFISKLENKPAICLYTDGDTNGDIFHFFDENSCDEICEMCEVLADDDGDEYTILTGTINRHNCVVLAKQGGHDALIFCFEEHDADTAYNLANRYCELQHDEDGEEEDE